MPARTSTKHPYAAIEHRVIDSPAYADLTFSARSLLVLLTRQLTKNNNGHLQATLTYMHRFGFSNRTLARAIKELIVHGMVYRSRMGGYQKGASQFAVTWLSITNREGLFLEGFKPCAWRDWEPAKNKIPPPQNYPPLRAKMESYHPIQGTNLPLAGMPNLPTMNLYHVGVSLLLFRHQRTGWCVAAMMKPKTQPDFSGCNE